MPTSVYIMCKFREDIRRFGPYICFDARNEDFIAFRPDKHFIHTNPVWSVLPVNPSPQTMRRKGFEAMARRHRNFYSPRRLGLVNIGCRDFLPESIYIYGQVAQLTVKLVKTLLAHFKKTTEFNNALASVSLCISM